MSEEKLTLGRLLMSGQYAAAMADLPQPARIARKLARRLQYMNHEVGLATTLTEMATTAFPSSQDPNSEYQKEMMAVLHEPVPWPFGAINIDEPGVVVTPQQMLAFGFLFSPHKWEEESKEDAAIEERVKERKALIEGYRAKYAAIVAARTATATFSVPNPNFDYSKES
jgi:hypothetical protein